MHNKTENKDATNENDDKQAELQFMHLQVLLPSKIFGSFQQVQSIVLETPEGAFGLLPKRRDCVASLEPGILTYTVQGQEARYLAVDAGVVIKSGQQVSVSVRNAYAGKDLAHLKQLVQSEFVTLDEQDREVRDVLARLESGFMRGFKSLNSR
jgi:F-type H+-transporting ATPase subunit epsilon